MNAGWTTRARRTAAWLVVLVLCALAACHRSPTEPAETMLANGRWTGEGACLSVTDAGCNLVIGCGHGQFPRPAIRGDGTFDADGTYRIEAGPVSIDPAPAAHFSGTIVGTALTVKVVPSGSLPPASGTMRSDVPGPCTVPCV